MMALGLGQPSVLGFGDGWDALKKYEEKKKIKYGKIHQFRIHHEFCRPHGALLN